MNGAGPFKTKQDEEFIINLDNVLAIKKLTDGQKDLYRITFVDGKTFTAGDEFESIYFQIAEDSIRENKYSTSKRKIPTEEEQMEDLRNFLKNK